MFLPKWTPALLLTLNAMTAMPALSAVLPDGLGMDPAEISALIPGYQPCAPGKADNEDEFIHKPEDLNRAEVVILVNKAPHRYKDKTKAPSPTAQTVIVYLHGWELYRWKTSTAREYRLQTPKQKETNEDGDCNHTPVGYFRPNYLYRFYKSKSWDSDMPWAIFFNGGIALHETAHVGKLGKRDSGGCVRLHPDNAPTLFDLVKYTCRMPERITYACQTARPDGSVGPGRCLKTDCGDDVTQIDVNGREVLDKTTGLPKQIKGYDVLVIVENNPN